MPASLKRIKVVQVQYSGANPVSPDYWRFETYEQSGAYSAAGLPIRLERVDHVAEPEGIGLTPSDDEERELVALDGALADAVADGLRHHDPVLVNGGSCHIAPGVVGGMQDALGADARIGIVWFDAHGDINTPATSPSGMKGGMPLACCAGLCWPAWRERAHMAAAVPVNRIVHWDGRDLDPKEEALMAMLGVQRAMSLSDSAADSLAKLVATLAESVETIYLHIDGDILDPSLMPGHLTPAYGGPDMAAACRAIELVFATGKVGVYSVCSVFPSQNEENTATAIASGCKLVRIGLEAWSRHGWPDL